MRFDKTLRLLALVVVTCCAQEAHSAESQQDWVRSAPPLAQSSRYARSQNTELQNTTSRDTPLQNTTSQSVSPRSGVSENTAPRSTASHNNRRYNEPKPLANIATTKPRFVSREFDQRLTALELALSTIVAEQPNLWHFDPLEAEAASLLMAASGEKDRQAVREVATRIDTFATLANRYRDVRGSLAKADRTRIAPPTRLTKTLEPKSPEPKTAAEQSKKSEAAALGYDAVGVLRSVVSKRPEAPKFALVDGKGNVTTFLTPTPDLNLQPMLGKRIGVQGSRGFMPAYKREHLTANRVTALDTVRR